MSHREDMNFAKSLSIKVILFWHCDAVQYGCLPERYVPEDSKFYGRL